MSSNNSTPNSNQPQSALEGRAAALAQIAVGAGLRSEEEAAAWTAKVVSDMPDLGQLAVDNMIAYLTMVKALSE